MPTPTFITMVDPDGVPHDVPLDQVPVAQSQGFRVEQSGERVDRVIEGNKEEYYDTAGAKLTAGLAGLGRGVVPFGLTDAAAVAIGGDDTARDLRELKERRSGISTVTEVAGQVLPALASGGSSVLAKAPSASVARLGARISDAGEGASAATRIIRGAAGSAVEGGIQGFGQGVSELALSEDPLTVERAISTLGSNTFYGGATGGVVGGLGSAAGIAIAKGKRAIDASMDARAVQAKVADDLVGLDAKALNALDDAEVGSLVARQTEQKAAAVGELAAHRAAVKEANPWLAMTDGESASLLNKSNKSLRALENDPIGLAKSPQMALKALRVEEQSFLRAIADREAITAKFTAANQKIARELGDELATLPSKAESVVLSGKTARRYADYSDVKLAKGGSLKLTREEASGFADALNTGKVEGAGSASLNKLDGLLESNRALQAKIDGASLPKSELTSPHRAAIRDAKDALMARGGPKSIGESVLGGMAFGAVAGPLSSIPVLGHILGPIAGAKVSKFVTDKVFGGVAKASGEASLRASKAVSSFLDVAAKASKVAPPLATKTLNSVRYAASSAPEKKSTASRPKDEPIATAYKARAAEIRSQTAYGPNGKHVVRPEARQAIYDRLAPIRAAQPVLADRMESLAARRIEFLASKLPKRPDVGGMQLGPDLWQPSDMEMRTFARYAAAVEDPHGVIERLAQGQVSPEDAEALRVVYPELMADVTRQIVEGLPQLQKSLPYRRRLALSIFTGTPADPSLDPGVIAVLQRQYQAEAGTQGGTQAPIAQPQFGSVSKEKPTPAQARSV